MKIYELKKLINGIYYEYDNCDANFNIVKPITNGDFQYSANLEYYDIEYQELHGGMVEININFVKL